MEELSDLAEHRDPVHDRGEEERRTSTAFSRAGIRTALTMTIADWRFQLIAFIVVREP